MIGFHSVMESPEPVSLVIPPNKTWIIIIPTPINNQVATGRREGCERPVFIMAAKVAQQTFFQFPTYLFTKRDNKKILLS